MNKVEEKALTDLNRYIASFNAQDLDTLTQSLDKDLQVFVDEKLIATGRDSILPSYENDFTQKKRVIVEGEAVAESSENSGFVKISVNLRSIGPESTITLHVVYTYNAETMKQVRHDISNVVVIARTRSE